MCQNVGTELVVAINKILMQSTSAINVSQVPTTTYQIWTVLQGCMEASRLSNTIKCVLYDGFEAGAEVRCQGKEQYNSENNYQ